MKIEEFVNTTQHNTEPFSMISVEAIFTGPNRSSSRRTYSVSNLTYEDLEDILEDIYTIRMPGFVISEISIVEVITYRDGITSIITRYDNAIISLGNYESTLKFFNKHAPCLRTKGKREG